MLIGCNNERGCLEMLFYMVLDDSKTPQNKKKTNYIQIEEALIEAIGQDSRLAFEKLYHQTERVLYAYVLSIIKNHEDTVDVVHDTYLKVRQSAHLYKPMGKPMAWILRIARNLAYDKLNEMQKRDHYEVDNLENDVSFSYVSNPEDRLILISVLEKLEETEREIILLHAVSGMKHIQIAKNLSMPLSTVLSKYHRGLKKLRKYLVEQGVSQ